jgi:hypothetical protein
MEACPLSWFRWLFVVQMLAERVLVFLVLLRAVLRQTPLAFGFYERAGLVGGRHAGRAEQPLEILTLAGLAPGRRILRPYERLELVMALAALILI